MGNEHMLQLVEKLEVISEKIKFVGDNYLDMKLFMKENILIDDEVIEYQEINNMEKELAAIEQEIEKGLIPRINNLI